MEIFYLLGLSVSFLVLAGIIMWMMVYTRGVPDWIKSVMIIAVLWYGMVVYHTPKKMMGWPYAGRPPEIGVILDWKVIEPQINPRDAGIYLWMVPKKSEQKKRGILESLIPANIFPLESTNIPRAYKFPFSEEEYRRLGESAQKLKQGDIITFRRGGKKNSDRDIDSENQYEVLKFDELFKKEGGDT